MIRTVRFREGRRTYAALLNYALAHGHLFSLVWRDQHQFGQSAFELAEHLQPYLEREDHSDEWPGTRLIGHKAWIRRYRMEKATAALLKKRETVYEWLYPDWPEDLAFYLPDGNWWFGSISHKKDAFVENERIDLNKLIESVPGLVVTDDGTAG